MAVLKHEGGYSNHPADNGGPTNKGITLANFRRYVKADGTIADLKALTTAQAGAVYRRQYWDAVAGAVLPAGIDYAVFDMGREQWAAACRQVPPRCCRCQAGWSHRARDAEGSRGLQRAEIINALCDKRLAWLKALDDWKSFGKGRVAGVRKLALRRPPKCPAAIRCPQSPRKPRRCRREPTTSLAGRSTGSV